MQPESTMKRAADAVGGQAALASICGVTSQAVSQWVRGIRPIPVERCAVIERATNGVVTRRDLRPDDWHLIWPELATPSQENSNG